MDKERTEILFIKLCVFEAWFHVQFIVQWLCFGLNTAVQWLLCWCQQSVCLCVHCIYWVDTTSLCIRFMYITGICCVDISMSVLSVCNISMSLCFMFVSSCCFLYWYWHVWVLRASCLNLLCRYQCLYVLCLRGVLWRHQRVFLLHVCITVTTVWHQHVCALCLWVLLWLLC